MGDPLAVWMARLGLPRIGHDPSWRRRVGRQRIDHGISALRFLKSRLIVSAYRKPVLTRVVDRGGAQRRAPRFVLETVADSDVGRGLFAGEQPNFPHAVRPGPSPVSATTLIRAIRRHGITSLRACPSPAFIP